MNHPKSSHLHAADLVVAPPSFKRERQAPAGSEANPLPNLHVAIEQLQTRREMGHPWRNTTIWLRGGLYCHEVPVEFGPQDADITIAAWPGESPIIDGGERVTGWQTLTVAGRTAWVADVAALLRRNGPWRSLFVNSQRRSRPVLPKVGFLWMEDVPGADCEVTKVKSHDAGQNRFVAKPGDIGDNWRNLQDIEVVVSHFWVEERLPIADYDPATRTVTTSQHAIMSLVDAWAGRFAKYRLENVAEALTEPGEWYLDRAAGTLTYLPLPGETLESVEVVVPKLLQLVRIIGAPGNPARNIAFEGVTFQHTDWRQPDNQREWHDPELAPHQRTGRASLSWNFRKIPRYRERVWGAGPQGALHVPGALQLHHAESCTFSDCTMRHLGWYAVAYHAGCKRHGILGCHLHDLGAGGILADGGGVDDPAEEITRDLRFERNHVHDTGHVWMSACGIIAAHAERVSVLRNHIHDLTYTGVSLGWRWNGGRQVSRENRVEYNDIYDIGLRMGMSDMGGIYTLGHQPGTVVRGNRIRRVKGSAYGGIGIYLDEGSALITVEQNIVAECGHWGLNEHWGRGNLIRDNIFAFNGHPGVTTGYTPPTGQLSLCRQRDTYAAWPTRTTILQRNLILMEGHCSIVDESMRLLEDSHLDADLNLYWDYATGQVRPFHRYLYPDQVKEGEQVNESFDLEWWRERGYDLNAIVADPRCADPRAGDFALSPDSPARKLGFRPLDPALIGPDAT